MLCSRGLFPKFRICGNLMRFILSFNLFVPSKNVLLFCTLRKKWYRKTCGDILNSWKCRSMRSCQYHCFLLLWTFSLKVSSLVLVFFLLSNTLKFVSWIYKIEGEIFSLSLLDSFSWGTGVCESISITICSSRSFNVFSYYSSWFAYHFIYGLGVCA